MSLDRRGGLAMAVLLTVGPLVLVRAGLTGDPRLHVPPGIAYLAAAILVIGAVRLVQVTNGARSSGHALMTLLLALMTGIGAWVAFGAGARNCAIGSGAAGGRAPASGLACRVPFGIGAALTAVACVYAVTLAVREFRARRGM